MKVSDFVSKAKEIEKTKTIYVYGTYGRPLTQSLIDAKAKQYPSQNSASRVKKYTALLGKGYHAWDCVGLIKGILWGWDGKKNVPYAANNVPDIGANSMNKQFINSSTNFNKIEVGEAVWLSGHIGIYIGDDLVIEASPRWKDGVQITGINNKKGYNNRTWTRHGKLPWVDYRADTKPEPELKPEPTIRFKDVPKIYWAYEYIENLANQGVVSGYKNTKEFKPDEEISRQHAAKMVALGAGLLYKNKKADFSDVNSNSEMSPYIAALVEKGAIRGYPDGTFRPTESITREQVAQVVTKAFELKIGKTSIDFSDLPLGQQGEYIKILASNGIIKGYSNGTFRPKEKITRAQLAKIIDLSMKVK